MTSSSRAVLSPRSIAAPNCMNQAPSERSIRASAPSKPRISALRLSTRLRLAWTPPGLVRSRMISQVRLIASQTSTVSAVRAARALSRAAEMQERTALGLSSDRVR